MSTYRAIRDVDLTLRDLVWSAFAADSTINGASPILASEDNITFDAPSQIIANGDPDQSCVNFFLYRILENTDLKNRPLELRSPTRLRYPPLSLNLFYLVTPMTREAGAPPVRSVNDHLLMGKILKVFYDYAIIRGDDLRGDLAAEAEELRVVLNPISMEDLTKLWSAFQRPFRLSVSYEVKVVFLDSERELATELVRRKRMEFEQIGANGR